METGLIVESFIPWSTLTPSVILAIVVMLIMLGWMVPRWFYMQVAKERDYWRAAHEASEKVRAINAQQIVVLVGAVDKLSDHKDLGAALLESVKSKETP